MTYQPRLFKNKTISTGRDCEERWTVLRDYVPKEGLLLDVGSSAGYFVLKSILEHPRLCGISLEASEVESRAQQRVLASHSCERICLVNGMMTADTAARWQASGGSQAHS